MMVKQTFIADLQQHDSVTDIFFLTQAQLGQAKNGPYWRLVFQDATGSIEGKIWSPQSQDYPDMQTGAPYSVSARVSLYRDKKEFAIHSMQLLTEEERGQLTLSDFLPSTPFKIDDMLQELVALCDAVCVYPPLNRFFHLLFGEGEIVNLFKYAPAAKAMHHAYAGGLLEHTLSVSRLCMRIANHYPQLDRQMLLAGAICHDIGKIWELTSGFAVDYTDEGRLIGHISIALEKLLPLMDDACLDSPYRTHLQHLIISHHGSLEFGSPKLPASPEAIILHYADNIDAKMQQVSEALSAIEDDSGWSSYNPSLERFLFKPRHVPVDCPPVIDADVPSLMRVKEPLQQDLSSDLARQSSSTDKERFVDSMPASTFENKIVEDTGGFAESSGFDEENIQSYEALFMPDDENGQIEPFFAEATESNLVDHAFAETLAENDLPYIAARELPIDVSEPYSSVADSPRLFDDFTALETQKALQDEVHERGANEPSLVLAESTLDTKEESAAIENERAISSATNDSLVPSLKHAAKSSEPLPLLLQCSLLSKE